MRPTLTRYQDDDHGPRLPVLVWRDDSPRLAISSAALGGGIGLRHWVLNMTVPAAYHRMDPDTHLSTVAAALELDGAGVGLMTAVDVGRRVTAADRTVLVTATVGLGTVGWAAAPDGDLRAESRSRSASPGPGTVNIVAHLPVRLSDAALVNAVVTATEAKAQALGELGVAATGTASDAISVCCPADGPVARFGGPRSEWGSPLARAVRNAVRGAAAAELGTSR